jgi:PTS system cellobiose-specific IIC component
MKKVMEFMEKYFVPVAAKIGSQRHLAAIRDGFVTITPLIIAGAMAVLINNLPFKPYQNLMKGIFGEQWTSFGGNVWNGTFAVMSLLIIFTISYNLARSYNSNGIAAAVVSFASLMMLYAGSAKDWAIPYAFLGAQGLFVSIFVALIATELFVRLLGNPKLLIKMPQGVPPAVSRSFAALFPSMIVLAAFGLFKCILTWILKVPDPHQWIFATIQAPLTGLADSLGSALLVVFLIHILWFFGLHGANIILPISTVFYTATINANIEAFKSSAAIPHIVTTPFFDNFIFLGGSGTSICLLIAIYLATKDKQMRSIANLGIAPALFNINEPVLFGLPIVLNPIFGIPFILTPMVLTIIDYIIFKIGIVPKTIALATWTIPPVIGGFITTGSVMGALLVILNLVIGTIIYIPFVKMAERYQNEIKIEESRETIKA